MTKKEEILEVCKSVAGEFPGWEFTAQCFKNKSLQYCTKLVVPLWTFSPGSALAQPIAGFFHKEADSAFKHIYGDKSGWTSRIRLRDEFDDYKRGGIRFYDIVADQAEARIRKIMNDGLAVLDKYYDFSSERALLEKMPYHRGAGGVTYCIVRAYLGDTDFVRRYRTDEIKTERPKAFEDVDKVMEYFNIVPYSN